MPLPRAIGVLALALACACDVAPRGDPDAPVASPAPTRPEATGALLVSVLLAPDGTAVIDALVPRSFAYVGPLVDWRPPAPAPAEAQPSAGAPPALTLPDRGRGALDGPRTAGRPPQNAVPTRFSLVVSHPSLPAPVEVPLGLGVPGGPRGDVADPWADGGLILRAPHYGPGTQVELMALDGSGARQLASARLDEP